MPSQPMRTPLRSWALPSSLMLIAAAVTGVRTGDDVAGPMTRTILREVRASCSAAVVRRARPATVRDGAAALDRWAWLRLGERHDDVDRCQLNARLTAGVDRTGMAGGAILSSKRSPSFPARCAHPPPFTAACPRRPSSSG